MKKKNIIATVAYVVAALAVIVSAIIVGTDIGKPEEKVETTVAETTTVATTLPPATTEAPPKPPFVSKKDFDALRESYPHVYAWIEIPGTNIDYPIIQHPDDETYYLRRDEEGNYSINGCIFSEHLYNTTDFTDPVTMIYGHYVYEYDGFKFFGALQSTYRDDLETCSEIIIYHPDKELHYEVFAAVPHHPYHVMYKKDYTDETVFNSFIEEIKGKEAYDATINKDYDVKAGDRILVLSTCYNGNTNNRFLVVAKLVEEIN